MTAVKGALSPRHRRSTAHRRMSRNPSTITVLLLDTSQLLGGRRRRAPALRLGWTYTRWHRDIREISEQVDQTLGLEARLFVCVCRGDDGEQEVDTAGERRWTSGCADGCSACGGEVATCGVETATCCTFEG
jgi:hypothetical protein